MAYPADSNELRHSSSTGGVNLSSATRSSRSQLAKNLADKPDTEIYRKSGTWKHFHADGAVIVHLNHKYIIAALVEHPDGGKMLSELIVIADDLMDRS